PKPRHQSTAAAGLTGNLEHLGVSTQIKTQDRWLDRIIKRDVVDVSKYAYDMRFDTSHRVLDHGTNRLLESGFYYKFLVDQYFYEFSFPSSFTVKKVILIREYSRIQIPTISQFNIVHLCVFFIANDHHCIHLILYSVDGGFDKFKVRYVDILSVGYILHVTF